MVLARHIVAQRSETDPHAVAATARAATAAAHQWLVLLAPALQLLGDHPFVNKE